MLEPHRLSRQSGFPVPTRASPTIGERKTGWLDQAPWIQGGPFWYSLQKNVTEDTSCRTHLRAGLPLSSHGGGMGIQGTHRAINSHGGSTNSWEKHARPLSICVALGKLLSLSEPRSLCL